MAHESHLRITSLQNPKVKEAIRLRERRARDETDRFLIEGYRELKRALEAHWRIETILFCPERFLGVNEKELLKAPHAQIVECSQEVFDKMSYRDRPDGLLAVALQRHLTLDELRLGLLPFLLIAERIEKPGNLGTMLRTADAAGVDGVIVADPMTDSHNPNVVRSSVGTLFTVPVVETTSEELLPFLQRHGIALVAATPHAELEFTQADFTTPLAIALGSEQYGLKQDWLDQADIAVRIPMFGTVDSLNVAAATALLLYEVVRQRRNSVLR